MSKGNLSKIDNLGRVVIPKSIRKALNIEHNDEISMYVDGDKLVINKGHRDCGLCGSKDIEIQIGTKFLCNKCIESIKDL
ncbi:MAG: AbrB family transcriptional regulator [Actinobacteria bacterium]|nr:AbrB family transcriptional regulator [Actinomycetota bacterium]|tara:strand:- start:830 stop:1069 length:240 start_codon:yes stop_codon:yes gene_type:complete